jgi:uncharacterized membrane protein YhiD involved in acid resistance
MGAWAEIIGVMASVIGVLVLGIKLLLTDWFKKSSELEVEKKKNTDKIQSRLDEEIKTMRAILQDMQETLRVFSLKLDRADIRTDELTAKLNETIKMVEQFQSTYSEKLRNMIKTEIVELTKNANLIRAKKIT